jgi:tetratricopeptide (TPR) repeat protein
MSSKVPTIKQTNWLSIIPHLIIMGILIFIWYLMYPKDAFFFGAITYLFISYLLRNLIPKDHRNGIKNNNSGKFEEAISDFQKSYTFFKKNSWIDKYRFITLLSSSKMSYQEMALVNIAFSYTQIGNGQKSKEYYEQALNEFPESILAKSALKMIVAAEENVLR